MAYIKKIKLSGTTDPYLLDATKLSGHTWEDVEALVTAGFTIVAPWTKSDYESTSEPSAEKLATVPAITVYYNNGESSIVGELSADPEAPSPTPHDPDVKKHIYLVYHPHESGDDKYDEYVSTTIGSTHVWEKIGNTDIDLSNYQQIGKTIPSTNPTTSETSSAGAATITSGAGGAQTATGTSSVTYQKADVNSSAAGGTGSASTTGDAGAATVDFSNATFTGAAATLSSDYEAVTLNDHSFTPAGTVSKPDIDVTTGASSFNTDAIKAVASTFTGTKETISIAGSTSGVAVSDHKFTPTITVSGSQVIADHTHTATQTVGDANKQSVVTGLSKFNGGSHTADSFNAGTLPSLTITPTDVICTTMTVPFTVIPSISISATKSVVETHTPASHAADSFTTNVPTEIDISKFSTGTAASYTQGTFFEGTLPSFTQGDKASFTQGTKASWSASVSSGVLSFSWATNGDDDFTPNGNDTFSAGSLPEHGDDSFTANTPSSLAAGFYTPGTPASYTQGTFTPDSSTTTTVISGITAGDPITLAPSTVGSASNWNAGLLPSYTQGVYTPASLGTLDTAEVIKTLPAITIGNAGGHTVSGSNFAASTGEITLEHTVAQGSFSGSYEYTPAGSIANTYTDASKSNGVTSVSAGLHEAPVFTGVAAILAHEYTDTEPGAIEISYTPEGSISGTQAIAAHNHSYTAPADHVHTISTSDAIATGTASVNVVDHTHSVEVSNHTHTLTHKHTITTTNNPEPL